MVTLWNIPLRMKKICSDLLNFRLLLLLNQKGFSRKFSREFPKDKERSKTWTTSIAVELWSLDGEIINKYMKKIVNIFELRRLGQLLIGS